MTRLIELPDRVTLVTPPSIFLLDERVFVNLGILKVAASLEQRGVVVDHLDLSGTENYIQVLGEYLGTGSISHIGITATTPQLPAVAQIIRTIRAVRPQVRVILGGPHVTLTSSAVKLEQKHARFGRAQLAMKRLEVLADVLVSGDGELAIFAALPESPAKLIDGDDPKSGLFMSDAMYESSPLPARHLVDLESYRYSIEGHRATSLIGQLGCPFGCGFCGGRNSKSLRMIRTRTPESIVEEIRSLYETYGYTGYMFYDDELNVSPSILEVLNGLIRLQDELQVELRFRGFVKSQLFTLEQATLMYRSGFRWLLSGFESGSPRILDVINKRATVDENTRAMEFARTANLKVKALMSVGHPGESAESIGMTTDWLRSVKPDDFDCTVITTYPGTPYYDEALPHTELPDVWTYVHKKTGERLHSVDIDFLETADYYKGDPNGGYRAFVFTDHLTSEQIVTMRNDLECEVRQALGIEYPTARAAIRFEHSMGQGFTQLLPSTLLRTSKSPSD